MKKIYPPYILFGFMLFLSACPDEVGPAQHENPLHTQAPKTISPSASKPNHRAQVLGQTQAGVHLQKLANPAGELGAGRTDVSGIYALNSPAQSDPSNLILVLPLALPTGPFQKQDFYLEMRNAPDSDWQIYQPRFQAFSAREQIWVFVPRPVKRKTFRTVQTMNSPQFRLIHAPANDPLNRYITVQREGSLFEVSYLPFALQTQPTFAKHVIPSDSEWQNQAPGSMAKDANTPDYIEDVIQALETGLRELLKLQKTAASPGLPPFHTGPANSGGDFKYLQLGTASLFQKPKDNVGIHVVALPDAGGESPLGGPIRLRNRFDNQDDLLTTATHELVHVLQAQYLNSQALSLDELLHTFSQYSLGLWFVDASAVYLTAKALNLNPERRKIYYSQFLGLDYLGQSLVSKSDSSMYPLGHFLDWLNRTYHPTLVENVLAQGAINPLNALDQELKATGKVKNLGEAWSAYGQFLLHNPEDTAGFAQTATTNLEIFSQDYLTGGVKNGLMRSLSETAPHISQRGEMAPLSMALTALYSDRSQSQPGWLVINAEQAHGMYCFSFPLSSLHNSQLTPGQKNSESNVPQTEPLVIKNFGPQSEVKGLLQLKINPDLTTPKHLNSHFHLVLPPQIQHQNNQSITWKVDKYRELPKGYIKAFEIYQDGYLLGEVPHEIAAEIQSFSSEEITGFGSQVQVVLRDQFGNRLPEVSKSVGILKLSVKSAGGVDIMDAQTGEISHSVIPGTEVQIQAQPTASEDLPVNWNYETLYDCGQGALDWNPEPHQVSLKSDNPALAVKVTASSQKNPNVKASVVVSFVQPFSTPCSAS